MFPGMIGSSSTLDVISGGIGGSRNGALQLVYIFRIVSYIIIFPNQGYKMKLENLHCRCMRRSKSYHHWSPLVKRGFFDSVSNMEMGCGLSSMFLLIPSVKVQIHTHLCITEGFLLDALCKICLMVILR